MDQEKVPFARGGDWIQIALVLGLVIVMGCLVITLFGGLLTDPYEHYDTCSIKYPNGEVIDYAIDSDGVRVWENAGGVKWWEFETKDGIDIHTSQDDVIWVQCE